MLLGIPYGEELTGPSGLWQPGRPARRPFADWDLGGPGLFCPSKAQDKGCCQRKWNDVRAHALRGATK